MSLSQEEIDACHEAFREVDVCRRGQIDVWELRIVLQGKWGAAYSSTSLARPSFQPPSSGERIKLCQSTLPYFVPILYW